jgi:hypothetical protein
MEVVALLLFIAALWVLGAVALFSWNLLTQHPEHADRLALLPIEDNWTDTQARDRGDAQALPSGKSKQS